MGSRGGDKEGSLERDWALSGQRCLTRDSCAGSPIVWKISGRSCRLNEDRCVRGSTGY